MSVEIHCRECGDVMERVPDREVFGESRPGWKCSRSSCSDHVLGHHSSVDLDLFCGVGGVARSLERYGTTPVGQVIGVDSDRSKLEDYPGYFVVHDLSTGLPEELKRLKYGIAWASPPCQFATDMQFRRSGENLIPLARELLKEVDSDLWILENVPGAREHLNDPVMLCGSAFNRGVRKHRLFETSFPAEGVECDHPDKFQFCIGDREAPVEEYREAHGMERDDDLRAKEVREVIPLHYVFYLWEQYLEAEEGNPYNGSSLRESWMRMRRGGSV